MQNETSVNNIDNSIKGKRESGMYIILTLPQKHSMISIDNFLKNITMSLIFKGNNIAHMYGCRICGYSGMLHRHGHYSRNVVTLFQHLSVDIQRFKCPSCNKTYSRLPCCLIPYFIYSFDVVIFCLYCVYALANKAAYACKLLHSINPYSFICHQSISFFKKRFISNLHFINSFFASFELFSFFMDLSQLTQHQSIIIVLKKIYLFDSIQSFNFNFFKIMPRYFMSSSS